MNFKESCKRIDRIDNLIKQKATGSPKELAIKLQVVESTVYEILKRMRSLGADIYFDKSYNSYCYRIEGYFTFCFIKTKVLAE